MTAPVGGAGAVLGSAGIGAAANIIGGLIGKRGQEEANATNIQLAREQMRFQERMSSTAYQRATTDLAKSGLNRILALGNPATTPAGARAMVASTGAPLAAGVAGAASSAREAIQQRAQRQMMQAQIDLLEQNTIKSRQDAATAAELQNLYYQNTARSVAETRIATARALQELMWTKKLSEDPNLQTLERLSGATSAIGSLIQSVIPGGGLFGKGKGRGKK